ncbi:unnamed protein product, partial [Polarella glacialis]
WLCGLSQLRRAADCVVFSYGLAEGGGSFEATVLQEAPRCRVFAFDPKVAGFDRSLFGKSLSGPDPGPGPGRLLWSKVGLAAASGGANVSGSPDLPHVESLEDGMRRQRVQYIDVLKLDSTGSRSELTGLAAALRRRSLEAAPLFGQLLLQVRLLRGESGVEEKVTELMDALQTAGYRMFSREVNPLFAQDETSLAAAIEFSFLHPEAWALRHHSAATTGPLLRGGQMSPAGPSAGAVGMPLLMEERVAGAAIYFLSHGGRFKQLLLILQQLHQASNSQLGYPVFLFLEDMPLEHQLQLQAVSGGSYDIHVVDIKEEFSKPLPQQAEGAPKKCRCSPHSSSIGYRRMCEFHAAGAARLLMEGRGFEWLWRLDDDSRLPSTLGYDPFRLMVENGQRYGTVVAMADDSACVEGLWQLAEAVAQQLDVEGLLPHGLQFFDEWLPGLAQYNNFEVSHVSVWRHPAYQRLWEAIAASGGVWQLRWGDAPIRTLGMLLTLAPSEVRFFQDVGYGHGNFIQQRASGLGVPRKVSLTVGCNSSNHSNHSNQSNHSNHSRNNRNSSNASCHNGSAMGQDRYARARAHGVLSTVPTLRYPPAPITTVLVVQQPRVSNSSNATLPVVRARENAVIYSLVHDSTEEKLQRLVQSFGEHFLREFPYPVVLFVDADDEANFATTVKAVRAAARALSSPSEEGENRTSYPARVLLYEDGSQDVHGDELGALLPFPLRVWRIPKLLSAPAWLQSLPDMRANCSGVRPEVHRAHVRRLPDLLAHELGFEWLWKVSQNGELAESLTQDPFLELSRRGKRVGHFSTMPEKEECLGGGLWEAALKEARWRSAGVGEAANFTAVTQAELPATQLEQWPRNTVFVSDSFISHASLWAAPAARRLLGQLDRQGGLWHYGWDEATLTTLAVLVASEESGEFVQLHALPFRAEPMVRWQRLEPKLQLETVFVAAGGGPGDEEALGGPVAVRQLGDDPVRVQLLPISPSARSEFQAWFPEAIKPQPEGWTGGDIATSVVLPPAVPGGSTTRLWFFGDSLVGTATADGANRTSLQHMVHHAVARSRMAGAKSHTVRTAFEWGLPSIFDCAGIEGPTAQGHAKLQEGEECALWPSAAVAIQLPDGQGSKLAIVAQRVARPLHGGSSINTLAFRSLGSVAIIVENPHEPTEVWAWRAKVLDEHAWWTSGLATASGTAWATVGGTIFVTGRQEDDQQDSWRGWEDSGRAVLGRIAASDLLALRLSKFEVLLSTSSNSADSYVADDVWAPAMFSPAPAESSLLFHPGVGLWLSPSVENARPVGALTLRVARRPEGPWSQPWAVVALPEELLGLKCYSAKAHLLDTSEADSLLVLSVVCAEPEASLADLGTAKAHIYAPRFFPLHLSPLSGAEKLGGLAQA